MALLSSGVSIQCPGWLRWRRSVLGIVAGLVVSAAGIGAQSARATAPQVQSIFLFHFAQFVEWPPQAFADAQTPVCIGVLGEDPFGAFLDETVRGERLGDRPFEVRRYRSLEEVKSCHILFVSRSQMGRLPRIVAEAQARSMLTVGEADDFARRGGMIQFATDGGKVRLQINVEAARAAHLTISSKLLRVAEIVTPENK